MATNAQVKEITLLRSFLLYKELHFHLGYLAYDYERGQAFIPNYEVKTAFQEEFRKQTSDGN